MEIETIIQIQRKCRKRAKKIVNRVYRKIDRIWAQRIRITEELEATGLCCKIAGAMPNLLLREGDAPDIAETTKKFGFANVGELAEVLASYRAKRHLEAPIYARLAAREFADLPAGEYAVATGMATAELCSILREAKEFAKEAVAQAYEKYDEVWAGKMRITWELQKHGSEVIAEINRKLPNFLTNDPMKSALDQLAMIYDFETSQDMVDWLLEYKPRPPVLARFTDDFARKLLGLDQETAPEMELDEVPF